jgi:hypothetical protein
MSRQISVALPNIKFRENPFTVLRAFICGQTEIHGEANRLIYRTILLKHVTKWTVKMRIAGMNTL